MLALALVCGGIAVGHYGLPRLRGSHKPAGNTAAIPGVDAHKDGAPVTVSVSPDKAFTITIPGAGTIHGDPDSVTAAGTITAQSLAGTAATDADMQVAGHGLDVTFQGTSLRRKVQVTFNGLHLAGAQAGTMDAVLHQRDDGTSEVLNAHRVSSKSLEFKTKSFSPNFPISIDLSKWFSDRFDSMADALTGRTDPDECPNNAPSWALLTSTTDMAHTCAITNKDSGGTPRAEAQFKTNRRVWTYMRVPPGAAYVWVKDMPDPMRTFLAKISGENRDNYVLMTPSDGVVTAGYYQPQGHDSTITYTFGTNGLTQLLSLSDAFFSALGLDGKTLLATSALLAAKCNDDIPGLASGNIADHALPLLKCIAEDGAGNLANPDVAFSAAMNLWGDQGYAQAAQQGLSRTKSLLEIVGKVFAVLGVVTVLRDEVNKIIDDAVSMLASESQNAQLHLTGTSTPATAPTSTNPPATQTGAGTPGGTNQATTPPTEQQGESGTSKGQPVTPYDNYGAAIAGKPMCRGNAGQPRSMPGGTVSQTFTVTQAASLTSALVQIDPDSTVTAHATLTAAGQQVSADATAAGDTSFNFSPLHVPADTAATLTISFTATYGKIITIYEAGAPGGMMTVSNSCSDGAPSFSTTSTGLRAQITGTSD